MTDAPDLDTVDLEWFVNAVGEDVEFARQSEGEARQMVTDFIGGPGNPFSVPEIVVERAVLEVGADLFYRRASRNGIVPLDGIEPQAFRISRDPMAAAYPLLRRYLVMGL